MQRRLVGVQQRRPRRDPPLLQFERPAFSHVPHRRLHALHQPQQRVLLPGGFR